MKIESHYILSDIDWIGELPTTWKIERLKDIAELITGSTPPKSESENYEGGTIPWIKPDQLRSGYVNTSEDKLSEIGLSKARLIPKGAILVGCIGDVGNFAIAGCDLTTNQQINSILFNKNKVDSHFGKYLIESSKSEHWRNATVVVVYILNKTRQGLIKVPLPPKEIQITIAKYLDKVCADIEEVIELKKKQLKVVEENFKSIVYNKVTRGLNDNCNLKPFEDTWCDYIPFHWNYDRLKDIAELRDEKTDEKSGVEDYLELEDLEKDTGHVISYRDTIEVAGKVTKFYRGDVLFGKLRPYLNKHHLALIDGKCTGEILAYKCTRILNRYFQYCISSHGFIDKCTAISYGAKMPRVDPTKQLANFVLPLPPIDEQIMICDTLDMLKIEMIKLKQSLTEQLETLINYKKSLIHEIITGKKQVYFEQGEAEPSKPQHGLIAIV